MAGQTSGFLNLVYPKMEKPKTPTTFRSIGVGSLYSVRI